jgi:hypothetical protein
MQVWVEVEEVDMLVLCVDLFLVEFQVVAALDISGLKYWHGA